MAIVEARADRGLEEGGVGVLVDHSMSQHCDVAVKMPNTVPDYIKKGLHCWEKRGESPTAFCAYWTSPRIVYVILGQDTGTQRRAINMVKGFDSVMQEDSLGKRRLWGWGEGVTVMSRYFL